MHIMLYKRLDQISMMRTFSAYAYLVLMLLGQRSEQMLSQLRGLGYLPHIKVSW